jgi:hypothetical protein
VNGIIAHVVVLETTYPAEWLADSFLAIVFGVHKEGRLGGSRRNSLGHGLDKFLLFNQKLRLLQLES